ncbi:response regulator [Cohnella endophytica]|uniref:Response regulator n=1 Tax=Cohnella endophytica TaxID=2419778 RepID=A0A494Y491_9BACL|nr:response regulator [Cohnella endophytica]RKP56285.1 response regulator [Cohnella endophytica]
MLKLLIVDDEPIILAGIKDLIEQANTPFDRITTACDGIEAIEMLEYFQPDLIITDIQMPGMNGLEFIRQAKAKGFNRFIILSGYDMFDYAQNAIRLQVVEYLLKPINESQLHELLRRLAIAILDQRQTGNPEEGKKQGTIAVSEHVRMLMDYIHTNYMKDISLSDAGNVVGMHPAYVGQIFKKETGISIVHYINTVRIAKAKELLNNDETLSLEKIASCIGFENRRTFYKVFQKHVGQTPGDYRNLNRAPSH